MILFWKNFYTLNRKENEKSKIFIFYTFPLWQLRFFFENCIKISWGILVFIKRKFEVVSTNFEVADYESGIDFWHTPLSPKKNIFLSRILTVSWDWEARFVTGSLEARINQKTGFSRPKFWKLFQSFFKRKICPEISGKVSKTCILKLLNSTGFWQNRGSWSFKLQILTPNSRSSEFWFQTLRVLNSRS